MGSRRAGAGLKVQRGGSPGEIAGVRKRIGVQPPGLRNDADALLCLAAATQHAESYKEGAAEHEHDPIRQESVSSDNDYSEEQYAPQQRNQLRLAGHAESEEEKKEKRRLANREAARRMRRRRATHMAAIEEEVERLTQENSLLLHRMTQLVASHQAVDQENSHLRQELMSLRASVGACLQAGQLDLASASLAPATNTGVSPTLVAPAPKLGVPALALAEGGSLPEVQPAVAASRRMIIDAMQRAGMPSNSGGQSTENEMTATEEERLGRAAVQGAGPRGDLSFASSGEGGPSSSMGRTQRKKGTAGWKQAGSWLATP